MPDQHWHVGDPPTTTRVCTGCGCVVSDLHWPQHRAWHRTIDRLAKAGSEPPPTGTVDTATPA